jgi:hypothetical protein
MSECKGDFKKRGIQCVVWRCLAGLSVMVLFLMLLSPSWCDQVDDLQNWCKSLPSTPPNEDDPNVFYYSRLNYESLTNSRDVWNARLDGDENMLHYVRSVTNINITMKPTTEQVVSLDKPEEIFRRPFFFMTGENNFTLNPNAKELFVEYFKRGGFIYADDCVLGGGGDLFYKSFVQEFRNLGPDFELKEVPFDHAIYHCFFDFERGAPFAQGQRHRDIGIFYKDKLAAFLTAGDVHCGYTGFWYHYNDKLTEDCMKMATNIIVYALTH